MVAAHDHGRRDGRQTRQGLHTEVQGLVGRPQAVKHVPCVQDEIWLRLVGDIEQAT